MGGRELYPALPTIDSMDYPVHVGLDGKKAIILFVCVLFLTMKGGSILARMKCPFLDGCSLAQIP